MLKILHISPTPLVAAPAKIAYAQRLLGHQSTAIALSDYPKAGPLFGFFTDQAVIPNQFNSKFIDEWISGADVIHVHNFLPRQFLEKLITINTSATFVYQAHSALREGPLYIDRSESLGIPFSRKLVVAQHWSRLYPDYIPVPNVILEPPSINLRRDDERLRVMFSPTHKHEGRWTNKNSDSMEKVLRTLAENQTIELIYPSTPVSPNDLLQIRRLCHVSIDEIVSGGFHQVSLEALICGNVCINRADFFARATFAQYSGGSLPPFCYSDEYSILDLLIDLSRNAEKTRTLQQASLAYARRYLNPKLVGEAFINAYHT